MPKSSAGLLMYRVFEGKVEVLLVHPGGTFWRHKDEGAWSIPKGEIQTGEDPLAAARREFQEETGFNPQGKLIPLHQIVLKSGKLVQAWAFEGNCNLTRFKSSTFSLEWPPKSGKLQQIPEVDQAEFWPLTQARLKINPAQIPFLDQLEKCLKLSE